MPGPQVRCLLQRVTNSIEVPSKSVNSCDGTRMDWLQHVLEEPDPMQTLAFHPASNARPMGGLDETLAQATLRRVEAKEFVFVEGDPTTHVFRVETGAVALYKVLTDGRRQIVGFAYPGDLIGLGAQGEHVMNAQAIKPTRLRCLSTAALHRSAASDP